MMTTLARLDDTDADTDPLPTRAYTIEVGDRTIGIVVRDPHGYTFHAAMAAYYPLDGQRFGSPVAAQKAARALTEKRTEKRPAEKRPPENRSAEPKLPAWRKAS